MTPAQSWAFVGGVFRAGATVAVTDRGFRYGMSVFETVAVYDGRLLFLEEHLGRLEKAVAAAGGSWHEGELAAALHELAAGWGRGSLRVYVTAGEGGVETAFAAGEVFAIFEEMKFPGSENVQQGVRLGISRAPLPCVLGGWKTGNYWMNVQALADARRQGLDETLVFNLGGALVSAAMANVGLLIEGHWQTPERSSGARDGVVLDWVRKRRGIAEANLSFEDVARASEIFITNSRLGVMPVAEIDGRVLPVGNAGELAALYREEVLRA